jgi:hypothetical protein
MTEVKTRQRGVKGALNRFLARHIETVLSVPGGRLYRRFVSSTRDVRATQERVLSEVMEYARDTVIGREHGFGGVRNHADLVRRVPVRSYEDHRPYVERHMKGERDVLFPGRPMMYNRSSGTTAKAKHIPVTEYNFEKTIKDRGKLWLYGLMKSFPGVYRGKDLTLVSPAVEGHTEDGTPYGSLSGLIYHNIPEFVKLVHTIPYSAMTIGDYDAKVYTLLRFALAADVSVILTGNPSTVLNLAVRADRDKEDLIRDIRDGTLSRTAALEPAVRREVEELLEPDPRRAAELERVAAGDRFRPVDYWPSLRLVHTWKNGNCRLVVPRLAEWFADTPILDFGYIASEITATDLVDPRTDGSILQVRSGFYEFTRYEDGEEDDGEFLMAHQLERGGRYFVYVTTFSGLYRYEMNDIVEVVDFFNEAPVIRFLFKGKGITSIVGEKLSEDQFIAAVGRAARRAGTDHGFFVGFADMEACRYDLYIELPHDTSQEREDAFAEDLDRALMDVNVEYEAKRKSDRLGPVRVVHMGRDFFARYRRLRLSDGAHAGQFKWMNLTDTAAERDRMRRLKPS